MMRTYFQKFVTILLLVALVSTSVSGIFAFPREAKGITIEGLLGESVPVEGAGGGFDSIGVVGEITQQQVDVTALSTGILQSEVIGAMNELSRNLGITLLEDFGKQAVVMDFAGYEQALVQGGGIASILRQMYGEDAVAPSTEGDAYNIAQQYENLIFNALPLPQVIMLPKYQTPQQRQKAFTSILVGVTSLLTSSISCGGINKKALSNATNYLAAASTGFLVSEINAGARDFYEKMAKLGNPMSTPPFWSLMLQDQAMNVEAQAKQAAALQIISPGIKSPQTKNPQTGLWEIGRSQSVLAATQAQTLASLFNSALSGNNALYRAGSLKDFLGLILFLYTQSLVMKASKTAGDIIGNILGGLFKKLGKKFEEIAKDITNTAKGASWAYKAQTIGMYVGQQITDAFVKALYGRLIATVFRGTVLAEMTGCRQPVKRSDFKSTINTEASKPSLPKDPADLIIFQILIRNDGQMGSSLDLVWEASAAGSDASVMIDKVGFRQFAPLAIAGTINDPQPFELADLTSQEYRLVVRPSTGPEIVISRVYRTVPEVPDRPLEGAILIANTYFVPSGERITVYWDATTALNEFPGSTVVIEPDGRVDASGTMDLWIYENTTVTMTLYDADGKFLDQISVEITVTPGGGEDVGGAFTTATAGFGVRE